MDELDGVTCGPAIMTAPSWDWLRRQHRVRLSITRGDRRLVPHSRNATTPEYDLLEVDPLAEEEPLLDVMSPSNPLLVEIGDNFGVIQGRALSDPSP